MKGGTGKSVMEKHFEVSDETVSSKFSDVLHRRIVQSCRMRIAAAAGSKAARHNDDIHPSVQHQNEAELIRMRQH